MAVENTALREELRHVPEVLQRALRLDQKRLEGHISRLQSEVRTLVADLVAANEATSSAEQRNEAVRAAAVQAATTEALQAARWAKKEALAKASAAVASALEHALSNAKVERDAVLAETKSNQEHALLEVRRLAQSKLDAAMAAAAHGARAAATEDATEIASAHGAELAMARERAEAETASFLARLTREASESSAVRDELHRTRQLGERAVQNERAAGAREKAQALEALKESYTANPIVQTREVIKEVPFEKIVNVEVQRVVHEHPRSYTSPVAQRPKEPSPGSPSALLSTSSSESTNPPLLSSSTRRASHRADPPTTCASVASAASAAAAFDGQPLADVAAPLPAASSSSNNEPLPELLQPRTPVGVAALLAPRAASTGVPSPPQQQPPPVPLPLPLRSPPSVLAVPEKALALGVKLLNQLHAEASQAAGPIAPTPRAQDSTSREVASFAPKPNAEDAAVGQWCLTQACGHTLNTTSAEAGGGQLDAVGVGVSFLAAVEVFYMQVGVAGETTMAELSGGGGSMSADATVQQLTAHTGTSLARACYDLGHRLQLDTSQLFGHPTCLVSYPEEYSCVADLMCAVQASLGRIAATTSPLLDADSQHLKGPLQSPLAFAWIDGFCSSPHASTAEVDSMRPICPEALFFASPLLGVWQRPSEPYLLRENGAGGSSSNDEQSTSLGPVALSRAQCVLESAAVLKAGGRLHIGLATHEWEDLPMLLETQLGKVAAALGVATCGGLQLPASASAGAMRSRFEGFQDGAAGALALVQRALRSWLATESTQALRRLEVAHGPRAPLHIRIDLANLLAGLGRDNEAEALFVHEATVREEVYGARHADTLSTVTTLARHLAQAGRTPEAAKLYRHAVAEYEAGFGTMSPLTLRTTVALAELLAENNCRDEASQLYRNSLKGLELTLGLQHPVTLQTIDAYGVALAEQGKRSLAASVFKRALDGYQKAYGPRHPETLGTMTNLANTLRLQGNLDAAASYYQQASRGLQMVLGDTDRETLRAMHGHASVLAQQRRHDDAAKLYAMVYEGRKALLGEDDPIMLRTLGEYAQSLLAVGRVAEGLAGLQRCLQGCERAHGAGDEETLAAMGRLAAAHERAREFTEAEAYRRHIADARARALGLRHERARAAAGRLVDNLVCQAKLLEAQDVARHHKIDWAVRQPKRTPPSSFAVPSPNMPSRACSGAPPGAKMPKGVDIEAVVMQRVAAGVQTADAEAPPSSPMSMCR